MGGCLKTYEEKLRENKSRLFHVRYEFFASRPFQMNPPPFMSGK